MRYCLLRAKTSSLLGPLYSGGTYENSGSEDDVDEDLVPRIPPDNNDLTSEGNCRLIGRHGQWSDSLTFHRVKRISIFICNKVSEYQPWTEMKSSPGVNRFI